MTTFVTQGSFVDQLELEQDGTCSNPRLPGADREEPKAVTERKQSKRTSPGGAHDPGLQGTFIAIALEARL